MRACGARGRESGGRAFMWVPRRFQRGIAHPHTPTHTQEDLNTKIFIYSMIWHEFTHSYVYGGGVIEICQWLVKNSITVLKISFKLPTRKCHFTHSYRTTVLFNVTIMFSLKGKKNRKTVKIRFEIILKFKLIESI